MKELSAEQKKSLEEMKALVEMNADRLKAMTTDEEVFAFFEEKGYRFSADEKEAIKKIAKEESERELSDEELSQIAGGWNWFSSVLGTVFGAGAGVAAGILIPTNPVGWVIGVCAGVGALGLGVFGGLAE